MMQPQDDDDLVAREFSEQGRSPRFPPGWWLIPGFAIAVTVIPVALYFIFR